PRDRCTAGRDFLVYAGRRPRNAGAERYAALTAELLAGVECCAARRARERQRRAARGAELAARPVVVAAGRAGHLPSAPSARRRASSTPRPERRTREGHRMRITACSRMNLAAATASRAASSDAVAVPQQSGADSLILVRRIDTDAARPTELHAIPQRCRRIDCTFRIS